MKLKEFLDTNDISYKTFADLVGSTPFTIHGIIHGRRLPTLKIALIIEEKTCGKVTCYDYLEEEKKDKRKQNNNPKKKKNRD